jgi:hypothetical protein
MGSRPGDLELLLSSLPALDAGNEAAPSSRLFLSDRQHAMLRTLGYFE